MAAPRHRDDPALSALWDDVLQVQAEGRARPPTTARNDQAMHARLAEAMEAYATAVATAGVALPAHFSDVMKVHRSRAGKQEIRKSPGEVSSHSGAQD